MGNPTNKGLFKEAMAHLRDFEHVLHQTMCSDKLKQMLDEEDVLEASEVISYCDYISKTYGKG